MQLKKDEHYWVYYMQADKKTEVSQVLIVIKIPVEFIDKLADELKIEATLTQYESKIFIKTPFWNG
jgi:DNA-dependent RNA polymerase auxiliary subunit epsilon